MKTSAYASALRDALERAGLRCTRQREAVWSYLCSVDSHPTAEQVFRAVRHELLACTSSSGGDFLYSKTELAVMREDMQLAKESGADGVVLGYGHQSLRAWLENKVRRRITRARRGEGRFSPEKARFLTRE